MWYFIPVKDLRKRAGKEANPMIFTEATVR